MAIANIRNHFIKEYDKALQNAVQYIGSSAGSRLYDCTFRINEVANQMEYAVKAILESPIEASKSNAFQHAMWLKIEKDSNKANFEKICKKVFKSLKAGVSPTGPYQSGSLGIAPWKTIRTSGIRQGGIYVLGKTRGGSGITFRFARAGGRDKGTEGMIGATDAHILKVTAHVRELLYHAWIDKYAKNVANDLKYEGRDKTATLPQKNVRMTKQSGYTVPDKRFGQPGESATRKKVFTDYLEAAHEPGSELGVQGLQWLRQQSPPANWSFGIEMHDITNQIAKNLGVDVDRKSEKKSVGGYMWEFHAKTSIRHNVTGSETGDISSIKSKEITKAINQIILKDPNLWKLFFIPGSKTPAKQVVDDTVRDIIRPLTKAGKVDRRFKINRKPKKFKPTRNKGIKVKKPKKSRAKKS